MGLRYNTDFAINLGVVLTNLSKAFDTLNVVVGKTIVPANILLTASTQRTRIDLPVIYAKFAFFKSTYSALRSSFLNTAIVPGPLLITGALSTGVALVDAALPTFELAMKSVENVTSIEMLSVFPSSQQQTDLKSAFNRMFSSVNRYSLTYRLVTQAQVNASLSADDEKTVLDFYTFYLNAINETTVRFNIILRQYTALANLQTALLKASCPRNTTSAAWNARVLAIIGSVTSQITVAIVPELRYTNDIVTSISKRVFSSNYDMAINCIANYQSTMVSELNNSTDKIAVLKNGNSAQKMAEYDSCTNP